MSEFELKIIEVKQNIFEENENSANELREYLKKEKTFMVNLMASPGAGKTTILLRTIEMLKNEMKIGILEADIDASIDAEMIAATGTKTIQLHTGGMCHMDADMTREGLNEMGIEDLDLVVLENVGNLVCPAEFDTGACRNVMILSVPEGDDKPLKYPLMFQVSDLVLINKIDAKSIFDFDDEAVVRRIHDRNPNAEIFFVSAKTGEGFDKWCDWLRNGVKEWQK
ncbi:MAG: hydrogenase nickel incorporation protein HypB [Dethiobacteria bacterium]|jgi:hydrogenase nickel incorporation protein HypB